jgi:hypothetical protein
MAVNATRFTNTSSAPVRGGDGLGGMQWAGQPGVGPVWDVPATQRTLLVWNDLPVCPPPPWYITERPIFIPGKGYMNTANSGKSVP